MATAVDVLAQVVAVLDIDVGYDIVHELSLRQGGGLEPRTMKSAYEEFIKSVCSFHGPSAPGVVLTIEPECGESCDDNVIEQPTLLDVAVIIVNGDEQIVTHSKNDQMVVPTCLALVGTGAKNNV